MKVVIINAVYGYGSTGRTYAQLQDYLLAKGHMCTIVYGNQKNNIENAYFMGNTLDHKMHALLSRVTGKKECYSTYATKKLLSFLQEYKPDVVHLGNLHGNYVNVPMLLSYLAENNIPTTLTLHDCFFFTGGCMHYFVHGCYKWQTQCEACAYYKELPSWFLDKTADMFQYKKEYFNQMQHLGVIGVSEWMISEAEKSPILQNASVLKRIYNWVDLTAFKPTQSDIKKRLNIENKTMILGVASSWTESKGLTEFIELSKILNQKYAIVLVGNIPETTLLPSNIIPVSTTNSVTQLAELYSGADVFVQLSKQETFGKVVAEALACGTPAVVYNSTASPELVANGCGRVVELAEGVEGISNAIQEIAKNGKALYAENCRKKAEQSFDKEKNCRAYLEVWENMVMQ